MEAPEPEGRFGERLFYDNLLLLGFEASALAKKYGASLGADMFRRSNPKAMEIVVYFLLLKIEPDKTKEKFRSLWPAVDRDQQRDFKKQAFEVLERLEKEGRIPPNSVRLSHLQTCFGERFYLLMWNLSLHALRVILSREYPKAVVPSTSLEATSLKRANQIGRVLKAQIVLQTDLLLTIASSSTVAQKRWVDFAAKVKAEEKDLTYQLAEAKEMQIKVEDELRKLPPIDEVAQSGKLKEVRAAWATLSQQAVTANVGAPMLEQVLARTCNSIRLESTNGDRVEPAALAEHWRALLAALQRSAAGGISVAPATKDLLEEQVGNHEKQLTALRTLNASLSSSLTALQSSVPSLLAPPAVTSTLSTSSAPSASLFIPPTPSRLAKSSATSSAPATRPLAPRRLQPALTDQHINEENLSQSIHAAAERAIAPVAPQITPPVTTHCASSLVSSSRRLPPIAPAALATAPAASVPAVTACHSVATQKPQALSSAPLSQRSVNVAPQPVTAGAKTRQVLAKPAPAQKKERVAINLDDSLEDMAADYVQRIAQPKVATAPAPAVLSCKPAANVAATQIRPLAGVKATGPDWSPAPARSVRLANMRARTQALLTASPPVTAPALTSLVFASPMAALTKVTTQAHIDDIVAEDEQALSDLSLSSLEASFLPSPIAASAAAPPVFELAASPPLLSLTSYRLPAAPTFTLEDEALTFSPLAI